MEEQKKNAFLALSLCSLGERRGRTMFRGKPSLFHASAINLNEYNLVDSRRRAAHLAYYYCCTDCIMYRIFFSSTIKLCLVVIFFVTQASFRLLYLVRHTILISRVHVNIRHSTTIEISINKSTKFSLFFCFAFIPSSFLHFFISHSC